MKANRIKSARSGQGGLVDGTGTKRQSLNSSTVDCVDATKGQHSASERVDELRKLGTIAEALEIAHKCWWMFYHDIKRTSVDVLLGRRFRRTFSDIMFSSAGSTINLFPNTQFGREDFRCWRESMDEAWNDDWFNVGADLYAAMSKAGAELSKNVESTENQSASCAIES